MKIRPVGAEFHADGQTDRQTGCLTDMTKLMLLFAILRTHLKIANPLRINS